MEAPTTTELAQAFDLAEVADDSLTPWARVYRATTRDGLRIVVKRTASTEQRAAAMSRWTRAMRAAGISVVTPIESRCPNPQQIGDDWWVAYPFIDGRTYEAGNADLTAAGDLLGQMHAAPIDLDVLSELRPYEWPNTVRADVDRDLVTLAKVTGTYFAVDEPAATSALTSLANRWWHGALPKLRHADDIEPLPRTGVSSDFKANNLMFETGVPTVVDPDNGGFEPRLLDLAMAVVLFHNECSTAPGRLFTGAEWRIFATAYLARVNLTDRERELWPAALDHMLWEEGTWVLEDNDADAWSDPRQASYLRDLAVVTPQRYPLPPADC